MTNLTTDPDFKCSFCEATLPDEIKDFLIKLHADEGHWPEVTVCPDCLDKLPATLFGMTQPEGQA